MSGVARRAFKDWAPRDHTQLTPEDHMKRMYSVGTLGSKFLYFNPVITFVSAFLIWAFVVWAMIGQKEAAKDVQAAQKWVTDVWDWLYMVSQNVWIVVLFYVLYKHYDLKLGKDSDEPEFSNAGYFAMLFSAGVATGLFYFTAEAMWHYEGYGTPRWSDSQMFNDNAKAEHVMMVTWFHWGVHGWVPYTLTGATIAILTYRRGFPMSMRFTLYPLIGEMCYGVLGDLIEVLSILCTVFGVCTSLGLGALQINKGLVRLDRGTYRGKDSLGCISPEDLTCEGLTGLAIGTGPQIMIILVITLFATASVIMGLKKGIQQLAMVAFGMSAFLIFSVLFMDNTWYILNALTSTCGYYLWYLPKISFHTDAWELLGGKETGGAPDGRGGKEGWMNAWTIFYWGWWISWGPFVGTFLARISKGRKLGEFIIATLILPSLWSFWFLGIFGAAQIRIVREAVSAGLSSAMPYGNLADKAVFGYNVTAGGTTVWQPVSDGVTYLYALGTEDVLFEHLASYGGEGYATFMTVFTLITIVLYFVTSSDSASFVVDIMAANGVEEPPLLQKIFWAFTEGAAAAALLVSASDGSALQAVKALPIVLGLPFTFLLFWMCQGLLILCKEESGQLSIQRKHFSTFLLNLEPASFVALFVPNVPMGNIATKTWGGSLMMYYIGFGLLWLCVLVLAVLGGGAWGNMSVAMYFMVAFAATGLRVSVRRQLGISGDMISDACACCFFFPCALGQMAAEDFSDAAINEKEEKQEKRLL